VRTFRLPTGRKWTLSRTCSSTAAMYKKNLMVLARLLPRSGYSAKQKWAEQELHDSNASAVQVHHVREVAPASQKATTA